MADFCNEYQAASIEQAHSYIEGSMSLQEAFDNDLIDCLGAEQFPERLLDTAATPWDLETQLYRASAEFNTEAAQPSTLKI